MRIHLLNRLKVSNMAYRYLLIVVLLNIGTIFNGFGQVYMYTTADLNLREQPSTSSRIILTIPKGTCFEFRSYSSGEWQYVTYHSQYIGYINSRYLSKTNPNHQSYGSTSYSRKTTYSYYYYDDEEDDDDDDYYYSTYSTRSSAYDAGYEKGEEDGYEDGSNCHYHSYNYDDSDCSGKYCSDYREGYSDGYDEGYDSGKSNCDEDD